MRQSAAAILTVSVLLALAAAAPAADRVAPRGLYGAARELLPDFAGFPAGTVEIGVAALVKRGETVREALWTFERLDKTGPLCPKRAKVRADKDGGGEAAFPVDLPAYGPMEVAKKVLKAFHARDLEAVKPHMGAEAFAKLAESPEEQLAEYEEKAGKAHGMDLRALAGKMPACLALPRGVGAVAVEYAFPVKLDGKPGIYEVEAELRLTDRDGPVRWVVEVLKPKFKDDQSRDVKLLIEMAVELQAGHAAPKGLRTLLDEFPVLDLASFPAGTKEIRCMAGILRHGRKFGVEARFGVSPDGAPVLNQYKVEEGEGERGVAPRFVLEENPVQAVRQALAFLEKGDFKAMLRYAPERDRKRMEEMDINVEEFLARMAEEMRKRGFSTISVISQNLPRVLRVPVVMGACSFRFEFPGEARGKKGDFQIEVECYVEKPDARSWIIKDMDVDFDARELGASEGSKGEDGKGPDKK